jgi:signal transduction histidine kinase
MSLDRITRSKILAERREHKRRIQQIRIERHLERLSRPPTSGRQLFMDVAPAVALTVFLVFVSPLAAEKGSHVPLDALAYVLLVVAGGVFVLRRRFPFLTYALALSATVTYVAIYNGGPIFVAAFAALITLVAARPRSQWIPAAVAGALGLVVAEIIAEGVSFAVAVVAVVWVGAAVLVGEVVRARSAEMAEIRARAELAERTRDQEALRRVAEERLRIAREVHDVVGHGLATISLQAGVAEHLMDARPEEARKSVTAIRQVSKQALEELRAEIGALRGDASAPRAPTPDLHALPKLVDSMRDAGLDIVLERDGNGAPPAEVVQTAGYRIVQEALTNVARHAGAGAHARVLVTQRSSALEVEVLDDGLGGPAQEGNGLAGMRERAAALGGSFEAGPADGGGFRVWARLPA